MNPVEQLLADLQAGNIENAEALNERIAQLSDEDLGAFEAAATELVDGIVDGEVEIEDGNDRLEVLETLATAVEGTRSEAERRYEAASEEQERLEAIRTRVHGEAQPEGEGGNGDGGEGTGDGDQGGEGEGDQGGEGGDTPPAEGDQVQGAEREPEPVSAAGTPARPRISRVAVRRPADRAPATPAEAVTVITAAAEIPGYAAGQPIPDFEGLTAALSARADAIRRVQVPQGGEISYHVATIRADYPEDRDLRGVQHNAQGVEQVITAALGRNFEDLIEARTAAGGFCAPPTPLYDQISIAEDARPARGALASFQATRGRVTYMPSPTWTDYASGVRRWTATNDQEALNNANVRKPCVRVDCDDTVTAEVYAIPVCVTVGNFFDRTYPERRQAILDGVMAWQARFAERELLEAIATDSTTVTAGQTLGAARDVLAVLDRAIAGFFSRYRVGDNFRLEFWAPRWIRNMMRADLVRALPVSGASLEENLAVADAQLERLFTARGLNVTWLWDGERGGTNQEFGAESGDALQNWPTRAITYLFHPGAHVFLDGGQLDLGIVRDSTLNATNDLQIWAETFEGVMHPGLESLRIDFDICPSGEISGTTDVTGVICTTGS